MSNPFSQHIAPFVQSELLLAGSARAEGDITAEFKHLENAHVLGQESTVWHVKVHILMLAWALRNTKVAEVFGQLFRIVGAATKTAFGLMPRGNTGGANVSPFKIMPISPEHASIIHDAKAKP